MIYSYLPKSNQENIEEAEEICKVIAKVIVSCNSLTNSHLSSSFIAFYGRSALLTISTIVKQVLINFKSKDNKKEGPFLEEKLFYSIIFQSIVKCICKGSEENINDMKELTKKITGYLTPESKNQIFSERFVTFITEIIDFSFTDPRNFGILECLPILVTKTSLPEEKIKNVYEHVKFYADNLFSAYESLNNILKYLSNLIGIIEETENSEKYAKKTNKTDSEDSEDDNTPQNNFQKPKIFKATRSSGLRERLPRSGKKIPIVSVKRKNRDSYRNEEDGIEEPLGKTRAAALKKKIK